MVGVGDLQRRGRTGPESPVHCCVWDPDSGVGGCTWGSVTRLDTGTVLAGGRTGTRVPTPLSLAEGER